MNIFFWNNVFKTVSLQVMQNMTKRDPEIYATTQRCWKSKQVQYSQYVNVITRYLKYLAHQTECEVVIFYLFKKHL